MKTIEAKKAKALNQYKETRAAYLENPSKENWIAFCNAKRDCRRFGIAV